MRHDPTKPTCRQINEKLIFCPSAAAQLMTLSLGHPPDDYDRSSKM